MNPWIVWAIMFGAVGLQFLWTCELPRRRRKRELAIWLADILLRCAADNAANEARKKYSSPYR